MGPNHKSRLLFFIAAVAFVYFWGLPYVYTDYNPSQGCIYRGLQGTRTMDVRQEFCSVVKVFPLRYPIIGSSDDAYIPAPWTNHPAWEKR